MKSKKIWISAFIGLVVCFAVFYYPFFIASSIERSVEKLAQHFFKGELQVQSKKSEKGLILIDQPFVKNLINDLDSGMNFNADQLLITHTVNLWKREIDLEFTFLKPQITLNKDFPDLLELLAQYEQEYSFFTINPTINIQEGEILLRTGEKEESERKILAFDGILNCGSCPSGTMTFSLLDKAAGQNSLALTFHDAPHGNLAASIVFDHVQCSELCQAAGLVFPSLKKWEIRKGSIDGKVQLLWPSAGIPAFDGQAAIKDLVFTNLISEVTGKVEELLFEVSAEEKNGQLGKLIFSEPSHFTYSKEGIPFFQIEQLVGGIYLEGHDQIHILLNGRTQHQERTSELVLEGRGKLSESQSFMDLNFVLKSPFQDNVSMRLTGRQLEGTWNDAEIDIRNFGTNEFDLFKAFFKSYLPSLELIDMHAGIIDASLVLMSDGFLVSQMQLEKIEGKKIQFSIESSHLDISIEELVGQLVLSLQVPDILSTLNAQLAVSKGKIEFTEDPDGLGLFQNIDALFKIREGIIQKSNIKAAWAGLEGSATLDLLSPDNILTFDFNGDAQFLGNLSKEYLGDEIEKQFHGDSIGISSEIKRTEAGVRMLGTFKVGSHSHVDTIRFGFDIEKTPEQLWQQWPLSPIPGTFWNKIGSEILERAFPDSALPFTFLQSKWLKHETGFFGFVLRNGWFEANGLALEKYLAPLLFPEGKLKLSGIGDFKGSFDHQNLYVKYDAQNLTLQNSDFVIEIQKIVDSTGAENPQWAEHYFDFGSKKHFGVLPVKNGTYFEKNNGLLFTDVKGDMIIEGQKVHIPEIETFCNGLYFAGNIEVDYSSPLEGVFTVEIHSPVMHGKVSQLQHMFSHFNKPLFFLKFPLEGNLAFHKKGGWLRFSFNPTDYLLEGHVEGILTDGVVTCANTDISFQELSMNFEYDHIEDYLDFSDIQGSVLVGKPEKVEEYALAGDRIHFTNYSKNQAEFDLWVGDKKRDVIRVIGKTQPVTESGEIIEFVLNQELTHFGDVHPKTFELIMKDWTQIEKFYFQVEFKLATLLHDLQRFSRTGLLFSSQDILKKVNDIQSAQGNFLVDISYDNQYSRWNYEISGSQVSLEDFHFQKVLLNGRRIDNTWIIDQLQFDKLSLAADILRTHDLWKINFLGLRWGEGVLLGLEGEYLDGANDFNGRINLLEANLNKLEEYAPLSDFLKEYQPKGQIRANGQIKVELGKEIDARRFKATLSTSFHAFELKGIPLADIENCSCEFISDRGIILKDLKSSIQNPQNGAWLAGFDLKKGAYDFEKQALILEDFKFNAPAQTASELAKLLHTKLPDALSPWFVEILGKAKKDEPLQGSFDLDFSYPHYTFRLKLHEGNYFFNNDRHAINQFVLERDLNELKITTQYFLRGHPLWLVIKSASPQLDSGTLLVSEEIPQAAVFSNLLPLTLSWKIDESAGFIIEKAIGSLSGADFNLHRDPHVALNPEYHNLSGEIRWDVRKMSKYLNFDLRRSVENWQIGEGYSLKGNFAMSKSNDGGAPALYAKGMLEGDNFEFKGYQFQKLMAKIDSNPDHTKITDLKVEDPSGFLQINTLDILKINEEQSQLLIPIAVVNEFRPSLLRIAGSPAPETFKPLVIHQLDLFNLNGILGEINSFSGNGKLSFANSQKKNFHNPLFAIPAEILSRIGLDLGVLNPVTGMIYFQLKEGKIHLTKFKDIFSEGKLSKFYLPNNNYPSYLDYEGNLHIQVRMKQYNLLFKLAELFTVTIQGTLQKPTFTLQRQHENEALLHK